MASTCVSVRCCVCTVPNRLWLLQEDDGGEGPLFVAIANIEGVTCGMGDPTQCIRIEDVVVSVSNTEHATMIILCFSFPNEVFSPIFFGLNGRARNILCQPPLLGTAASWSCM